MEYIVLSLDFKAFKEFLCVGCDPFARFIIIFRKYVETHYVVILVLKLQKR